MKYPIIAIITMLLEAGCSSQKTTTSSDSNTARQTTQRGEKPKPPSLEEVFKMDTNNDGKLSKTEVKGPLQKDFSKIDSNGDGFISREELKNAPRRQRGPRPAKN